MTRRLRRPAGAIAVLACGAHHPTAAHAHEVFGIGGFPGIVLHPLIVLDHMMALLALALLLGQQGRPSLPRALGAFLAGLVLGFGALFAFGPVLPGHWLLPLIVAGGVGAGVALAPRLPAAATAGILALTGYALGANTFPHAHGWEMAVQTVAGTGIGMGALLLALAVTAARIAPVLHGIAVRVVGSWIAASALLVLALVAGHWEKYGPQ